MKNSQQSKRNRYFEEVALDLLDFCGGQLTIESVNKFFRKEDNKKLSDLAQLRVTTIALSYTENP